MKLTISLGQMDVLLGQPELNLAKVRAMCAEAAKRGSDWVLFPELWSTGYDLENAGTHATATDQGVFAAMAQLAQEHHLYLLGSCLSRLGEGGYGNTLVMFAPDGSVVGEYSKIHLFRLMEEDQFLTSGNQPVLAETPWGKVGLTICYDLRFPELFRSYALQGAKVVVVPAEWPHPRLPHWQILLRARAIENQLFIVACNRVGSSKNSHFFGHSTLINPWGETVIAGGEEETLLTATIDTELVDTVRAKIPVFADRRPNLYALS